MSSPPSYPVHEAEVALDQAESSRSPHDDDSESRLIDVIETIGNVSQWTGDSDGLSMLLQGVNSFVENLPPLVGLLKKLPRFIRSLQVLWSPLPIDPLCTYNFVPVPCSCRWRFQGGH